MDSRNLEIVINALGEVIHDRDLTISCLEYRVKKLEDENESLRKELNIHKMREAANNEQSKN